MWAARSMRGIKLNLGPAPVVEKGRRGRGGHRVSPHRHGAGGHPLQGAKLNLGESSHLTLWESSSWNILCDRVLSQFDDVPS